MAISFGRQWLRGKRSGAGSGKDRLVDLVAATDTGRRRSHNEDYVACEPALGIAVLADGMGGYQAGEVASSMAARIIIENLSDAFASGAMGAGDAARNGAAVQWRGGKSDDVAVDDISPATHAIREAIATANSAVHSASLQPRYKGMGTTVVVAAFHDGVISVAHVGDSRLYRLREGHLERLTVDHSLLQELVDKGFYTEEEAAKSGNKNYITRALGIDPDVTADILEDVVLAQDVYLLCSDGLSDLLSQAEIAEILNGDGPTDDEQALEARVQRLIEAANAAGGHDNVSAVLARATASAAVQPKSWFRSMLDWF